MRQLVEIGISQTDRKRILQGLHEGRYNLLLGAGSSYGSTGSDGGNLVDGATLSKEINKQFSLNLSDDESSKLTLSYEEAESKDKAQLHNWLKSRLTGCTPTWQEIIFRFHWDRIWTFNIDDVLENAFPSDSSSTAFKNIAPFDWKESLKPLELTRDSQQIIYLHGRACDLGTSREGVIFSIEEYSSATKTQGQWHASFQTHYLEDPFIICGASLTEETDIATAIRRKNQSTANGFPSLIVSFNLTDSQIERMKRYNLIPVVCPLPEFFSIINNELLEYRKNSDNIYSILQPGTYERFSAQFRKLDFKDTSGPAIDGTDFYGGDEPTWKDILDDLDTTFHVTQTASSLLSSQKPRYAALIHGDDVSGKTTALFRIARKSLQNGFKVFWFRHEESFDADVATDYLSNDEKAIIFIDDAGNHLEAVGRTLQQCKASNKIARIFLTLRSSRLRGYRIDIGDEFRLEYRLGNLIWPDLTALVRTRRKATRLGKHISKSNKQIAGELQNQCRSALLECISYIEFSEPLQHRIRRIIKAEIIDQTTKSLIAKIACVHRFGFSLPLRAALSSSGIQFSAFKDILDSSLKAKGIVVRDQTGIRLRHRILSQYAWLDSFTQDDRYQAMSSVVKNLAPLINPSAIKTKSIEHLILREILDQEQVSLSIGDKSLKFYEDHESDMGWSSRYWDQRALLESKIDGHFSKAYSYSQKAIYLEKHPFAYTSFGSICLTEAIKIIETNRIKAMELFYEGESALSTAEELSRSAGRNHEHPYVKFFATTIQLLRRLRPTDTEYSSALELLGIWIRRAEDSPSFSTSHGRNRINEMKSNQLKFSMKLRNEKSLKSDSKNNKFKSMKISH